MMRTLEDTTQPRDDKAAFTPQFIDANAVSGNGQRFVGDTANIRKSNADGWVAGSEAIHSHYSCEGMMNHD